MIIAAWRERRIAIMESSLFELEMERQRLTVDAEFAELGPGPRQVLALFGTSDASAASALLLRYGASARRSFASAFRILRDLQGERFNRNGVISPASISAGGDATTTSNLQAPPPEALTAKQAQPPAAAAGKSQARRASASRLRFTLVRRYEIGSETQHDIAQLPNEPKQAATIATNGASQSVGTVATTMTAA